MRVWRNKKNQKKIQGRRRDIDLYGNEEEVRVYEPSVWSDLVGGLHGREDGGKRQEQIQEYSREIQRKKVQEHRHRSVYTVRYRERESSTCLVSMGRRDVISYSGRLLAHQLCPPSFFCLFSFPSFSPYALGCLSSALFLNPPVCIYIYYLYKCTAL